MPDIATEQVSQSQADRFAELSRALECDEDEDRFKKLLGQVVKHKPVPVAETPE